MIKFHVSTTIRTAVSTHVAEILRDAGPQVPFRFFVALPVPLNLTLWLLRVYTHERSPSRRAFILKSFVSIEIERNVSTHSVPSARVLRLLATNHIFIEVSPDVFAKNRLSTVLDTGKPVEELILRWALLCMGFPVPDTKMYLSSPESKYVGTLGMTTLIGHLYEFSLNCTRLGPYHVPSALMKFSRAHLT
jgi:hypothetical protein